ncbi:CMT1A duplicated region transcript 15 protein-like protein [Zalophus californianus]|uniref:CMT1A duplicated region transcript 15 protein-like protein n=1 Tax=Zalophus californianus TaxID=9704 RepID=A0A6J2EJB7_ZALCA|nr:CMT1A duplicated region transcript 15 protein-like protein [Zalophus californianus]
MFTCCLPKSRGCRLKKARPADAVPRWGFCVRAPHRLWPFGRKDRKKATDDLQRRLADIPSTLTEGLTPQASPGTDAGDCRARPPRPPRPLSQVVVHRTVQEPESMEAKPEAAPPPEELEPAPTPSAALEGRGGDCSDFRRRPGTSRGPSTCPWRAWRGPGRTGSCPRPWPCYSSCPCQGHCPFPCLCLCFCSCP